MVDVVKLRPVAGARLWLRFSDSAEGEADIAPIIAQGGPMVQPLADPSFFARVFIEMGAPTWPNGFDLDAINLYMQMDKAGRLKKPVSAK
ncbi:MAG: DUF2442 domain-containing protein [Alphaproteobacteria bacterium]|nr:DUF2442 domain-containing protein [Alphaproteobacteria bacterium]